MKTKTLLLLLAFVLVSGVAVVLYVKDCPPQTVHEDNRKIKTKGKGTLNIFKKNNDTTILR